jgi:ubiquinone/menaquinone biosynthesis C-methylase UbiE
MSAWDVVAPAYDSIMGICGWHRTQATFAAGLDGYVLEVGCGTAYASRLLGQEYVGVDISMAMLMRAEDARVVCADASALPFGDRTFDRVVSTAFLGLLEPVKRTAVLREFTRVCRSQIHLLEPVEPLDATRRAFALSRHPLRLAELTAVGVSSRIDGPALFAGVYTPITASVAPDRR